MLFRSSARLRRARVRPQPAGDEALARDVPDDSPGVDLALVSEEQAEAVRAALVALPENQRVPLELAYYEGLSQSEIAARLSEPLGTVKTRMQLGMKKLRDRLAEYR